MPTQREVDEWLATIAWPLEGRLHDVLDVESVQEKERAALEYAARAETNPDLPLRRPKPRLRPKPESPALPVQSQSPPPRPAQGLWDLLAWYRLRAPRRYAIALAVIVNHLRSPSRDWTGETFRIAERYCTTPEMVSEITRHLLQYRFEAWDAEEWEWLLGNLEWP
jgi:hypothetical protein